MRARAVSDMDAEQLAAWVTASRARCGLGPRVTDPDVIGHIEAIVTAALPAVDEPTRWRLSPDDDIS